MTNILVVDDDIYITRLIENIFKKDYTVYSINELLIIFELDLQNYYLILLDIMMKDMDGFEICKNIRELVDIPIIFLTAKVMEEDIVKGLSIGADDYITKPFNIKELRARVQAHLRREHRDRKNSFTSGDLRFIINSKICKYKDKEIDFTKSEYEIVEFLALNSSQVFTKDKILEKTLGYDSESDESAIVEHIKNIRKKLKQYGLEPIKTVWGVGYKWQMEKELEV